MPIFKAIKSSIRICEINVLVDASIQEISKMKSTRESTCLPKN